VIVSRARRVRRWLAILAALVPFLFVASMTPAGAATGSWSDRLADVAGAAQLAGSGRGVTVAVLDTWVDIQHPDFGGRVAPGVTCTQGQCLPGADRPDACDPHGTHVTGIVAGARYGVAPEAKVLPIRVLTSRTGACAADAADVALGIRYAVAHHIKIINVSLGSTFPLSDPAGVLPAAVTAAKQAGALVVVAAGNGKATAASTYGTDALTVAALGPSGAIASYSQRGAGVDIAAPGGDAAGGTCDPHLCVVSTWQDGGYASDAGTSMAAPFVSGAAALLLSQNPRQSMADVRTTLLSTATPLADAGAGTLDVLRAVQAHAPGAAIPRTGTDPAADAGTMTGSAAGVTPSVTSGSDASHSRAQARARTTASDTPAASRGHRMIGPVQLLGIVVVIGVGLAVAGVVSRRRYSR
jgi:subtilisin family serine protease